MATVTTEVWSELDEQLIVDPQGAVKKAINLGAVLSSVDNILGTYPGERVMRPTFASPMENFVFEDIDDFLLDSMARDIKEAIETWDDRPVVNMVDIKMDPDNHFVQVRLNITIAGYNQGVLYTKKIFAGGA